MVYYKIEGLPPLNGLNFYKPSDPVSAGFLIKLGVFELRVRYSKRVKKWFFGCCLNRRTETNYSI
jgi:hypothetical protein